MLTKATFLTFSLFAATLSFGEGDAPRRPIRTTAELRTFRDGACPAYSTIDITGQIVSAVENTAIVEDDTGRAVISLGTKLERGRQNVRLGNILRIEGETLVNARRMSWDSPTNITFVGQKALPDPITVRIDEIDARRDDLKSVIIDGTVVAAFKDEIDARYQILILKDERESLPVYVMNTTFPDAMSLSGGRIRVSGVFYRHIDSYRFFPRSAVISQRVDVLTPPPADPFEVPELKGSVWLTLDEIGKLGRRRLDGRVLAAWDDDRLMLKTGLDNINVAKICFARMANGTALPEVGSSVTIAGEVDASFFNLTLTDAVWRKSDSVLQEDEESPKEIVPHDIFLEQAGKSPLIDTTYQGVLVRIAGTLASSDHDARRLIIDSDGVSVPVDVSALPESDRELTVGSRIRVTGRCLLELTKTSGHDMFPRINGFTIVARTGGDLETLALPPWWTPGRLLGVIAALLAALFGFAVWIRVLNRLVQRRGEELSKAEIARASSELRIAERTRLAVELHDSISQNLTGIALAINAGELKLAERSLKSCREELRNCLWDLRSNALEEFDLNEAIRKTLAPNLMSAKLTVRFRLARNTLSDTTAYAILRIIRELTVNGIRHGGATEIRVAGSVEEDRILFSVHDNGSGFDPENAPGIADGHFGLEGVRERVSNLNGEMEITSSPKKGTKVTICLQKPKS